MKYQKNDINNTVTQFQMANSPTDRYASFDYCYYYFRLSSPEVLLSDMEKSCLAIGFYLASWGMLRGSSFLLNKSARYYEPLIKYIAKLDRGIWDIDVDSYNVENIKKICEIYKDIQGIIIDNRNSHITLVTKIMLGVFGFVPAFDNYFGDTFRDIFKDECRFRSLNDNSLNCIHQFYEHNKDDIDTLSASIFVTNFSTGRKTNINYTKSKVIDMYGFTKGLPRLAR
ncbi:hypothetical protein [Acidithiobacillus sp.]|uniref:hypothetical protein n=1 Tax=Acidithiobacillus sp. TaxID=1872118 RepID=UPI00231D42D3|nr:hypothetical protein [Acidithiobacillus sp.]MDA8246949.1 hypothetical protein [Acidithiobacillus sp.]